MYLLVPLKFEENSVGYCLLWQQYLTEYIIGHVEWRDLAHFTAF